MRGPIWIPVVVVIGVVLGVAIAGVPSRHADPPLRLQSATVSTTTLATASDPVRVAGAQVGVVVVAPQDSVVGANLATRLASLGYLVAPVVTNHIQVPSVSVVEYRPGFDFPARFIASTAGVGAVGPLGDLPLPSRYMGDASVMVVVGSDLKL